MSRFQKLPELVEDLRHAVMTFRRSATAEDLDAVKSAPAAILRMAHRDMDTATEAIQDADRRDMELADYLVGQYEEAIVLLGSMIPE